MNKGKAIKIIRKYVGMTQAEVAAKMGIFTCQISVIETGKGGMTHKFLERLCDAMGVPAAMVYLYSLDEDDVKPERLHLYRELKPILDNLFKRIFLDED